MAYYDNLSPKQKENIAVIIDEATKAGITNENSIAGLLAVISKESSFIPQSENLNYSAQRLQEVFGISAARAKELEGKPQAIANAIYGGRFGNMSDEGWKYRGRGFIQLTFKDNYRSIGNAIGVDLVANPDKVNDVRTASKVAVAYYKRAFDRLASSGKLDEYNAANINDFKNTTDATLAFYHATAGAGKDVMDIKKLTDPQKDRLGGMTKALDRVKDLLKATGSYVKKNPIKVGVGIVLFAALVGVGIYLIIKKSNR